MHVHVADLRPGAHAAVAFHTFLAWFLLIAAAVACGAQLMLDEDAAVVEVYDAGTGELASRAEVPTWREQTQQAASSLSQGSTLRGAAPQDRPPRRWGASHRWRGYGP